MIATNHQNQHTLENNNKLNNENEDIIHGAKPQDFREDWGYTKANGPSEWGKKYESANGKHQSPIDINTQAAIYDQRLVQKRLEFTYDKECFSELKNTGHTFIVCGQPGANSRVSGGPVLNDYRFLQFHMHWSMYDTMGSEHLVDGKPYAAELHFVNWNAEKYAEPSAAMQSNEHDGLIVLGVFVKVGAHNLEFDKLIPSLGDIYLKEKSTKLRHALDYKNLFPTDTASYWTYEGSLTTPPCTECVQWVVFKDPIEISHNQLKAFHRLYRCEDQRQCCDFTQLTVNYRPVCELNERKIFKSFE